MKNHFTILRQTRKNIFKSIDGLSIDQLNKIPEGFNNNIIWNVAHVIVTQQLLIYKLSGTEPRISSELIDDYRKGTKASKVLTLAQIDEIKSLLINTVDWLEEDYEKAIFGSFKDDYPTSYNVVLKSAEDSIIFNNVHEGLHFGYLMAMKKLV